MENKLSVKNLTISFRTSNGRVQAVRGINFDLAKGETLSIVGESGSGKSVTSKAILGILAGNSIVEGGEILYDGKDLLSITEEEMCKIRGDKISMIFQDPLSSLNPIVKIGKQITEAMLLKNKTNKKEARAEFNKLLGILKECMLKAEPDDDDKELADMIQTFDNFAIEATKLETPYNESMATAETLISVIKNFLFMVEKEQEVDAVEELSEFAEKLAKVKNEFILDKEAAELETLSNIVANAKNEYAKGKKEKITLSASLQSSLENTCELLQRIMNQTRPNFFRLGYFKLKGNNISVKGRTIEDLNEEALQYLDANFMKKFLELSKKGVKYSYNIALEAKKTVVPKLMEARKFYEGNFQKAEAIKLANELANEVDKSIDRLEINKDSAAYAFRSSMLNAINKYFYYQKNNPKEEARFARQSAKREALIARGKTVDWKVVPKNVLDLEELKAKILYIIDRLIERYNAYIEASESVDYDARCLEIVNYLKEKASQVVYTVTKAMAKEKAIKLMEEVGIHEPRRRYYQYPFEFSGGMRQRIVIAIALAADPDILICDEPTTALDVTIQAQILELINKLKVERNLSVVFITHDLGVVANMADDIAVMYAGKIVEYGTAEDIFYDPRHPYTWALLSSMPDLDTSEKLDAIPGTPPNMIYPPVGDAFAERNKYAMKIDFEQQPPMFDISETHKAATWLLHPNAPKVEMPKIITDRIARMKKNAGGETDGRE